MLLPGPRRADEDANVTVNKFLSLRLGSASVSNVTNTILPTKPAFALYRDRARHLAGVDAATPLPGSIARGAATNPEIVDNHYQYLRGHPDERDAGQTGALPAVINLLRDGDADLNVVPSSLFST
jgi:hypothetical protein